VLRRASPAAGAALVHHSRLRRPIRVDQPLLLITQAQRSGGTLLLRLLDGHPQCHVVPFQLRGLDQAAKQLPSRPNEAWASLHDPKLATRFQRGHRQRKHDVLDHDEVFPFRLPPHLQRIVFDACARRAGGSDARTLVDCYFTSYFNAWLDYRNLETGTKRWLVGFEPGVARSFRRRGAIQALYPDGKVVSIVRDPWSWYASARRWEPRWHDRERALDHWCSVGGGTLKWRRQAPRQVRVLAFDDLLARTEQTVRRLADWLEIEFRPELLQPTFNGRAIRANTSFADVTTEVSTRPLDRARDELDAADVDYIDYRAGEIYRRLRVRARRDWKTATAG
jgi:Sulfotransferase family